MRSICDDVATILSDNDEDCPNTRWSKEDLECWEKEARKVVAIVKPTTATTTHTMKLSPGKVQTVPEGCGQVVGVLGIPNENGSVSEIPDEGEDDLAKYYSTPCNVRPSFSGGKPSGTDNYSLSSYELDVTCPEVFYVSPSVPEGSSIDVLIKCVASGEDDNIDLDCRYDPILKEWMLYKAYSVEMENPNSAGLAGTHLQNFYNLISLAFNAERFIVSGGRLGAAAA